MSKNYYAEVLDIVTAIDTYGGYHNKLSKVLNATADIDLKNYIAAVLPSLLIMNSGKVAVYSPLVQYNEKHDRKYKVNPESLHVNDSKHLQDLCFLCVRMISTAGNQVAA
jgi:hypothetical protein